MERHIAYIDIPDFHVALEQARRPELRDRPVVLAESIARPVVLCLNDAARREGLHEGMSLSRARRLCRGMLARPPDHVFYERQHRRIQDELEKFSPLVEGHAPGSCFVDLTGTRRLWGPSVDAAFAAGRHLLETTELPFRTGLGGSKLISQMAARCVDAGDLGCVFAGGERAFLGPLPVGMLPGVGAKTAALLSDLNIEAAGQLAALAPGALEPLLGWRARRLVRAARGEDPHPVVPFRRAPRLVLSARFGREEIDRKRIEAFVFRQAEEAGWMFRRCLRFPGRVTAQIRYADGVLSRGSERLSARDPHLDRELYGILRNLVGRLFGRRVALSAAAFTFEAFSAPLRQMSLFPGDEEGFGREKRVQEALDRIRRRFGRRAVSWGKGLEGSSGKPGGSPEGPPPEAEWIVE